MYGVYQDDDEWVEEYGAGERCPKCGAPDWHPDPSGPNGETWWVCESCSYEIDHHGTPDEFLMRRESIRKGQVEIPTVELTRGQVVETRYGEELVVERYVNAEVIEVYSEVSGEKRNITLEDVAAPIARKARLAPEPTPQPRIEIVATWDHERGCPADKITQNIAWLQDKYRCDGYLHACPNLFVKANTTLVFVTEPLSLPTTIELAKSLEKAVMNSERSSTIHGVREVIEDFNKEVKP